MSLEGRRIGFIGAGAMAEALAGGLRAAGIPTDAIRAADPDAARRAHFEKTLGIGTHEDNAALVGRSDLVVLAVKPAVVEPVLKGLGDHGKLDTAGPLWISIAAGVTLARLEAALGPSARCVRAMPNTPALVRAGATALCANGPAGEADRAAARALFEGVGITWETPDEGLLDAVTGLSGSGPAYVFAFLEALVEAGVRTGLPREAASRLAAQTLYGAALMVRETGRDPAELRRQVSSPGGTTEAGLARLEALGLGATLAEAVAAATARSRELGSG